MPRPRPAVPIPRRPWQAGVPCHPQVPRPPSSLCSPPWMPPVLWDRVTLTCQGSGTAGATTWYKDGQRWRLQGPDRFVVTESGTYQCDRPGTGCSPLCDAMRPSCPTDRLVLQVPARALLEGDTVTLRCWGWQNKSVTGVRFYHKEKDLGGPLNGTELSLSPLQLHHCGRYRCNCQMGTNRLESVPVTVTVHGEHPHGRHPKYSDSPTLIPSRLCITPLTWWGLSPSDLGSDCWDVWRGLQGLLDHPRVDLEEYWGGTASCWGL
uniref:Uncharacterized protein n=1 Tax=Corvus moneduloides TaxID=1196302 RepID=A0A8U7NVG1_CORMO